MKRDESDRATTDKLLEVRIVAAPMALGKDLSITYRVTPRYTSGEPRNVDYRTALSCAEQERAAYIALSDGKKTSSDEEQREATLHALRGIVEAIRYRDDNIEYQDFITDERGVRRDPAKKRKVLHSEKNEQIIANALRVAVERYRDDAKAFQPDAPASLKTFSDYDIRQFLGWLCIEQPALHHVAMETLIDDWGVWSAANSRVTPNARLSQQFLKQEQEARQLADDIADVGLFTGE